MIEKRKKHKILLGLTTTPRSDWREKIREIEDFGLEEVALFPTWLKIKEREDLYGLLEKTGLKKIPHIHLRDDTQDWEMDYYVDRFKTELFNIHINRDTLLLLKNRKHRKKIFLETTEDLDDFFISSLDLCGGICLDASHCEDEGFKFFFKGYHDVLSLVEKYPVGCCHISAVGKEPKEFIHYRTGRKGYNFSDHWLSDLFQLDYVNKYVKHLPEYVSIELENSFREQIEVKNYLEKIINGD